MTVLWTTKNVRERSLEDGGTGLEAGLVVVGLARMRANLATRLAGVMA